MIPSPDPLPLPAPPWLLLALSILTLTLHLLAMNLAVGGGILSGLAVFAGKTKMAKTMVAWLPAMLALTITLGVAPLLFLQVIYGQLFYAGSILIAWPWLAIIALLLIGYYGFYWASWSFDSLGPRTGWVAICSSLALFLIGMLFTMNTTLQSSPGEYLEMYRAAPHGFQFYFGDPAFWPRFLHFVVPSVAIAGLGAMALGLGRRRAEPDLAEEMLRFGRKWFQIGTGVQILIGVWLVFSLDRAVVRQLMGQNPVGTGLFMGAMLLIVASLVMARRLPVLAMGSAVVVVAAMVGIRQVVRNAQLSPHLQLEKAPWSPQWEVFAIFALSLIAALVTVIWMLVKFGRAWRAGGPASKPV